MTKNLTSLKYEYYIVVKKDKEDAIPIAKYQQLLSEGTFKNKFIYSTLNQT